MTRVYNRDLVLKPSLSVDPNKWDESKYEAFVDELCIEREYQKIAIFNALRFLLGGNYQNLRELARKNYDADSNPKIREAYGSWDVMESRLQLPDMLSCSLDLATGTGKSYVLYGLATIMLAEGVVDRVLVLCPSLTIESGLTEKFRQLAANNNLRGVMPTDAIFAAPRIINANETIVEGDICVENYHAILDHVGSSIRNSFAGKGGRTLILNDEAHHVATSPTDTRKWKTFLLSPDFGFRYVVGVSGTCYIGNDYFSDVVSRYSLREAIEDRVIKNVDYVAEAPSLSDPDEKWQLIYQNHQENIRKLKGRRRIQPLSIIVTKNINSCDEVAEELCAFLCNIEGISEEQAKKKILVVTSSTSHRRNVARLGSVDNLQSGIEWIISVSMLTEGWDVKNVFQIVPHEERAFNSKLLIAQVLGRGLRVPENWSGEQPIVTVFNHSAWSGSIKHLVDEILDIEQRISSVIIGDSPFHFDLHDLKYERLSSEVEYPMEKEYNIFEDEYINLPTVNAEDNIDIEYERIRGKRHVRSMIIRHKIYTAVEISIDMHEILRAIDRENDSDPNSRVKTNYAKKYPREFLEEVVRKSVRRARINEDRIPDEIRQRLLSALNVLRRRIAKRVTYLTEEKDMYLINTGDRQTVSCSAAELLNRTKTIFYRSNAADYLPAEQKDFFTRLTDEDGDFAGQAAKVENDYIFKTPVNLAIADHEPERRFIRSLTIRESAEKIAGWIKNADMGFYSIEYAWRRISHAKRGTFSPDFFIKMTDALILVVEIKDDSEVNSPSHENVAKYRFASEHFDRLNARLGNTRGECCYQFNMLTPQDYSTFFQRLRAGDIKGYKSYLDVAIKNILQEESSIAKK